MILIGQYDSPFVRRVAVSLRHYAFDYEHRPWSVWRDAEKIGTVSPLRRVPILVMDDGEALFESSAVVDALDDLVSPERALVFRTGRQRRDILKIAALASGLADKAVSLLYEHILRKDGARSETWVARCRQQIEDALAYLERSCEANTGDFWFGALSHADIAVACTYRFITEAHGDAFAHSYPALRASSERCEALDIFKSVVQPLYNPL
jgi:glutathione S-transferase